MDVTSDHAWHIVTTAHAHYVTVVAAELGSRAD
jgi:hypothetical protein